MQNAIGITGTLGIKSVAAFESKPIERNESAIIIKVNDGILSRGNGGRGESVLFEFYAHKGIAELAAAIIKQRSKKYTQTQVRNGNAEIDFGHRNLRK
jgi:hypothetical protein